MKFIYAIIVAMFSIFSFSGRAHANPEQDFWNWFQKNESMLFDFERDQARTFDRLANEMHKVHPDLTFEFGPKNQGRREFVISADGIKTAFPKVESLFAAAPKMTRWQIIKFRPRREPADLSYGGVTVKASSVFVSTASEGEKVSIRVYIPGYSANDRNTYLAIAFLMLDQALGEFDVETRVGSIDVESTSQKPANAQVFGSLPTAFDALFTRH